MVLAVAFLGPSDAGGGGRKFALPAPHLGPSVALLPLAGRKAMPEGAREAMSATDPSRPARPAGSAGR